MKLREKIDSFLEKALILIMSLMVVNVLWQVFSRYLLTNPSSFTDELARYLMIWVGVLGAAYVSGKRSHVAITYFADKLNEVRKRKLRIIIDLLILAFSFFGFILGGFRLVYITSIFEQYSHSLLLLNELLIISPVVIKKLVLDKPLLYNLNIDPS